MLTKIEEDVILGKIAEDYKHDFYRFAKEVMGYKDLGEIHKGLCMKLSEVHILNNSSVRRIWLWARGHFKTTLITNAHTIWLIINNPNIRILIGSNIVSNASKILGEIKAHFIHNPIFRELYPEFCPKPNKEGKIEWGTGEQFTVRNRTEVHKEPTCMVAGVGTELTGLHFDYMKLDDLVTDKSVTNDEQIQASKDFYGSLRQLFDNPEIPREDIIGTPYHFNDLYNSVEDGLLFNEEFDYSLLPAKGQMTIDRLAKLRVHTGDEVNFKERFSEEGLDLILKDPSVGPYIFSCQYQLSPLDPSKQEFKEEWITYD